MTLKVLKELKSRHVIKLSFMLVFLINTTVTKIKFTTAICFPAMIASDKVEIINLIERTASSFAGIGISTTFGSIRVKN